MHIKQLYWKKDKYDCIITRQILQSFEEQPHFPDLKIDGRLERIALLFICEIVENEKSCFFAVCLQVEAAFMTICIT